MSQDQTLQHILSAVQGLQEEMQDMKSTMATKDDLAKMESGIRADMATKDDLAKMESGIRADMATKDDIASLRSDIAKNSEGIDSLTTAVADNRAGIDFLKEYAAHSGDVADIRMDTQKLRLELIKMKDQLMSHMDASAGVSKAQEQESAATILRITRIEERLERLETAS